MQEKEMFINFNEKGVNNTRDILRVVENAVNDILDNPQKFEGLSNVQKEEYRWYQAILENGNDWDGIPYHFFEKPEVALLTMFLYGYKSNIHQSFLKNKEMVLKFIEIHPAIFLQLEGEIGSDMDVCIQAAKADGSLIAYMENGYNEDILKASLSNTAIFYQDLPFSIREKKEISLIACKNTNFRWEDLPYIYKNDKEIILETLKNDITYFHQLDENLRYDIDIAWVFVKSKPVSRNSSLLNKLYENTSEEIKNNIDIACHIMKEGGGLSCLTESLAKNRDLLKQIVVLPNLVRVSFWLDLKKETLQDINLMAELMDLENKAFNVIEDNSVFNNTKSLYTNQKAISKFIDNFGNNSDEAKNLLHCHKDSEITWDILKKMVISYVDDKQMRKDFDGINQVNLVKKRQNKF